MGRRSPLLQPRAHTNKTPNTACQHSCKKAARRERRARHPAPCSEWTETLPGGLRRRPAGSSARSAAARTQTAASASGWGPCCRRSPSSVCAVYFVGVAQGGCKLSYWWHHAPAAPIETTTRQKRTNPHKKRAAASVTARTKSFSFMPRLCEGLARARRSACSGSTSRSDAKKQSANELRYTVCLCVE